MRDKSLPDNELNICSFISKGHGQNRIEYMKNLLTICDIMLLQEHCYFEQDIKLLENVLGNVQVYGVYGMCDNELRPGLTLQWLCYCT